VKRFIWPQYLVEPQYVEGCVEKTENTNNPVKNVMEILLSNSLTSIHSYVKDKLLIVLKIIGECFYVGNNVFFEMKTDDLTVQFD
jgi:hypothetical protein